MLCQIQGLHVALLHEEHHALLQCSEHLNNLYEQKTPVRIGGTVEDWATYDPYFHGYISYNVNEPLDAPMAHGVEEYRIKDGKVKIGVSASELGILYLGPTPMRRLAF
jgi:hypothetical protein